MFQQTQQTVYRMTDFQYSQCFSFHFKIKHFSSLQLINVHNYAICCYAFTLAFSGIEFSHSNCYESEYIDL